LFYFYLVPEKQIPPVPGEINLFFHREVTVMNYYVIINENELQIIAVSPDQVNAFTARYGWQVIICGDCIVDALVKFEEPVVIKEFASS
jgi:hypothetical protein